MLHTIHINIWTKKEFQWHWDRLIDALMRKAVKIEDLIFLKANKQLWMFFFKTTHRCGSLSSSHVPIFNNHHNWLWKHKRTKSIQISVCQVCGETVRTKIGSPDPDYQAFKRGREADVVELQRLATTATNNEERRAIRKSIDRINNESIKPGLKGARESLVRATRKGDVNEIKNIHEHMVGKDRYSNE